MMAIRKVIVSLALAATLAGCAPRAADQAQSCAAQNRMTQTTLYFGLNRPSGPVITGEEWQRFVDNDVTPRFRDGLTVFDARGQWLGNDGKVAHEPSKALMLIHSNDSASEKGIEALRGIYKSRFAQESVMRVDERVCVQF
ncbi:DUF3574 domain-containing protein [Cronobacter turicensis]|uniref:DUF3574 domain-containing protein n=1 Tax=Cronobacter TaxID=413496 RepID=UPI001626CFF0|nr:MULTISPECIES: DUF3574 domain-containing protein [Cronobacter]EKM0437291.1 DUF3574 domain-containing protein [Cronobacter turicensis]ELQ6223327.1 DUF3574 domain-containing protein [Cronobacter turicensis]ELY4320533.1 DUF3574 domain-containing protein [Cronobacter turicensis]ELY5941688.1 DUF3574 domain-containing protein [Cronobacter turicensis]ELY5964820.1 DUF3574 domain-containing protein [Cronobacter turicensis]